MQVNFNADAWHRRLQTWTFKDVPRFDNLCPYFWLTVFCLLMSPFTSALKLTLKAADIFIDSSIWITSSILAPFHFAERWLANRFDPKKEWRTRRFIQNMSDEVVYHYWKITERAHSDSLFWNELHHKANEIITYWKSLFPDWEDRLKRIAEEQSLRAKEMQVSKEDAEEQARKISLDRRAFYMKLSNLTAKAVKPVAYILGVVLVLGLVSGSSYGIYWLVMNKLMLLLKILGGMIASAVGTTLLVATSSWFSEHNWFGLGKIFDLVLPPAFSSLWKLLRFCLAPFNIFFLFVRSTLSNNCPAIAWQETEDD